MRGFLIGSGIFALPFVILATQLHWGEAIRPAMFAYPDSSSAACLRPDEHSIKDLSLPSAHIRTPKNYDPTRLHPLLVIFSPAGANSHLTERWIGVTQEATRAGYIVAYIGSIRLGVDTVSRLSEQLHNLIDQWCVDRQRITFAGHSDGGTISQLLALLPLENTLAPQRIVSSGAGLRGADFEAFHCPQNIDVRIYHGAKDKLFPGYGQSATAAWAECMDCQTPPINVNGCEHYQGCKGGLRYCEIDAGHYRWLPTSQDMLEATPPFTSLSPSAPNGS